MEIRNLVTFLKVTELKSFSKAAESLDYSQSAVTVQIQQLERELGVRLFDRIGKNVSITQYGEDFVSYARDVVSAVSRAIAFAAANDELTGRVRVGTLNSMLTAAFPEIVPIFHQRFPRVVAQLHAGIVSTLLEKLIKNEVDLIYTVDSQIFDTQFIKIFEEEEKISIIANRDNPLLEKAELSLADLIDQPFLLMNRGNAYRDLFDQELARQGLEVHPFVELEDDMLVLHLIQQNPDYLTVLPHYAIKKQGNLTELRVKDCSMHQWRQILYHRNKVITPQIQGMLDVILSVAHGKS